MTESATALQTVKPARKSAKRRGPGRPPLSQTQRVINAVRRGAQDAKTIATRARVPSAHVHPILSRLRREGVIEGFTGSFRVIGNR